MKESIPPFRGFSRGTFQFLEKLSKNNNIEWFQKNRSLYQNDLILPAKAFINEIGQFFSRLNPSIRTAPKFNETIMRLNKDMRFNKGEPYRNFLLLHFGKFKMDSEFYVYLDPKSFDIGLFINNSDEKTTFLKKNLSLFPDEFIKICKEYKVNNIYSLFNFYKVQTLVSRKFNAEKHIEILASQKMSLIQKSFGTNNRIIFSPNFLEEAIKHFSVLYPVYCFSVSADPIKLINEYREEFGMITDF